MSSRPQHFGVALRSGKNAKNNQGDEMSEGEQPQEESVALVARAAELVRQAEEANRKANSEAGFAFNAKNMAEEHATAIAGIKGRVESDVGWFTSSRQAAEEAQAVIATARAEAESAQRALTEVVAEVEKLRAATKIASTATQEALAGAQEARSTADAQAKAAAASNGATSAHKDVAAKVSAEAQQHLEKLTEQAKAANEQAGKVNENAAQIQKALETSQATVSAMAGTEKKAATALAAVIQHEADLARLKGEFQTLHDRIEAILPYATSASLASAFREQKGRFSLPQWMWLATFIITILGLLVTSIYGLPKDDSWDSMARHLVNRLPLIAPLVWLAIYAGRHYGLALRLQEEYAYKEAVAAAFEGFRREMSNISASGPSENNPLVTLCGNVLSTLGQRPGRIYESKHEDITPLNSAANALKDTMQAAKDLVAGARQAAQAATSAAKGSE